MSRKKEIGYLITICLLLAVTGQVLYSYHYIPQKEREIEVYYNKEIEANRKIIQTIQEADQFVYFAIYTFTRSDIKDALLGAKHRGLEVVGVTDEDQVNKIDDQAKIIKELKDSGVPIYTQNHSAIMHLKTLVTDKAYVNGSYNWTLSATDRNDEIIEIGKDQRLRKNYQHILETLFEKYDS